MAELAMSRRNKKILFCFKKYEGRVYFSNIIIFRHFVDFSHLKFAIFPNYPNKKEIFSNSSKSAQIAHPIEETCANYPITSEIQVPRGKFKSCLSVNRIVHVHVRLNHYFF